MKIRIIKDHAHYDFGIQDVPDERANYLIKMGVAEEVKDEGTINYYGKIISPVIEDKVIQPTIEIKRRGPKPKIKL